MRSGARSRSCCTSPINSRSVSIICALVEEMAALRAVEVEIESLKEQARLRAALGVAIVFAATHDFDYAERIATRALYVNRGKCREMTSGAGSLLERYRAALAGDAA